MSGPGTVARCRDCDTILLMLTERHGMYCVDLRSTAGGRPRPASTPIRSRSVTLRSSTTPDTSSPITWRVTSPAVSSTSSAGSPSPTV
ncbi:hypothetical protein ACWCOV_00465 [Kribbella sp. NPDC002412]